jgi:glycosyltransferase involved in cell wall biosynthesis
MFLHTEMPVGGAETLLVNLVRRLDPQRIRAEICCLKRPGPLGEVLGREFPLYSGLLKHKYDPRVLVRLTLLLRRRKIDAIVTVGAGDRMFWGRLAARLAGVPVVLCALHSTGWPDCVGRLNRLLTPLTDGFIAVAEEHARYLRQAERFPAAKVFVIRNGVDVERFHPAMRNSPLASRLGLPAQAPTVGIIAALRPEKDHELFLRAAARVRQAVPAARFLIVGDGQRRAALEQLAGDLKLNGAVSFLGTRSDIPDLLSLMDTVALTSKMEANPVTLLEALACGKPVVAPRVGSIGEAVRDGITGKLYPAGDENALVAALVELLNDPAQAAAMGRAGRDDVVVRWSLDQMVGGYQDLIEQLWCRKQRRAAPRRVIAQPSIGEHST